MKRWRESQQEGVKHLLLLLLLLLEVLYRLVASQRERR
jgi:hypothetical protein